MRNFTLTDTEIVEQIKAWLTDTDADDLARVAGEMFGGKCYADEWTPPGQPTEMSYYFKPNENYWGAFGEADDGVDG